MIDLPVFRRLLDLHGANLARWPESMRVAARHLRARSPEAGRLWRDTQRLDRHLDRFEPQFGPFAMNRLRAAILQSAGKQAPLSFIERMFVAPLAGEAALFTTIAVVGLTIGLFMMGGPLASAADMDVIQLISSIE